MNELVTILFRQENYYVDTEIDDITIDIDIDTVGKQKKLKEMNYHTCSIKIRTSQEEAN